MGIILFHFLGATFWRLLESYAMTLHSMRTFEISVLRILPNTASLMTLPSSMLFMGGKLNDGTECS